MNLLSFTPLFTTLRLIGSQFNKLCFIGLITLSTSQTSYAFELNTEPYSDANITTASEKHWNYRNLVNGKLIKKLPSILVFRPRDAAYMVEVIKNEYLTFYSKNNKKIKATYDSGTYLIKYTHRW